MVPLRELQQSICHFQTWEGETNLCGRYDLGTSPNIDNRLRGHHCLIF